MNINAIFPARIGLGTWKLGEQATSRTAEINVVTHALHCGYRVLDTAEMYGSGGAESVIGAALRNFGKTHREELFIVSKVLPQNASRRGVIKACEASLHRLDCEYLDLYLLHWPGQYPFIETLQAFAELHERGLIMRFGVSNFDVAKLEEWLAVEHQLGIAEPTQVNQIYYCLQARGVEFDLLPWQRRHGIFSMAYSPLGLGELAHHPVLKEIAEARGATAAQIALAWVIRHPDMVAIPKSVHPHRVEENLYALHITLSAAECARIDAAFAPPQEQRSLEMI